ncbi:MAG: DUF951 domain-containing protein [Clostridia bacterium]|nr:DUF951 domain-containing protein [Clostridia bacterium]
MQIIRFKEGDLLELRKKHPCGCPLFRVVRLGSDVRILCTRCGRDLTLERVKLEKAIKKVHDQSEDRPDGT